MSAEEIRKIINLLEGKQNLVTDEDKKKMQSEAQQFIKSAGYTTQARGSITTINHLDGRPVMTPMSIEQFDKWLDMRVFFGSSKKMDESLYRQYMRGYNKFTPEQTQRLGVIMRNIKKEMVHEGIKEVGDAYEYSQRYHYIYLVNGHDLIGKIGSTFYEINTSRKQFGQVEEYLGNRPPGYLVPEGL